MMALVAFLVPVFEGVFKEFGGELPAMTQVSVFLSEVVTGYWWAMFGGTVLRRRHLRQVEENARGGASSGTTSACTCR